MNNGIAKGLRHLGGGIGFLARNPGLSLLGMVPPLVVSAILVGCLVALALSLGTITGALTTWTSGDFRSMLQWVFGVIIMLVGVLLAVILFSSLTLLLGTPVYERISLAVERERGGVPGEQPERLMAGIGRSIAQSLALLATSVLLAIPIFFVGLIPAVGGIVSAVLGALVGGTMISLELIGGPFDRRGRRRLGEKLRAGRGRRAEVLGFGIPVFLLFSVPLVQVVLFPAATAGGTLLARSLLGEPTAVRPPAQ